MSRDLVTLKTAILVSSFRVSPHSRQELSDSPDLPVDQSNLENNGSRRMKSQLDENR